MVLSGQKDHVLDISAIATDEFRSNQVLNRGTVYFEASEAFDEYWLKRTNLRWPCLNQLHLWLVWIECCLGIERQAGRDDSTLQLAEIVVTGWLPHVEISLELRALRIQKRHAAGAWCRAATVAQGG